MKAKSEYQKARDRLIKAAGSLIDMDAREAYEKLARIEAAIDCLNGLDSDEIQALTVYAALVKGEINGLRKGQRAVRVDD